jgi:hypothetical protein
VAAAGACEWSGVATDTASISLHSSSILRQSVYFFACGNFAACLSRRDSSTSQSATMFSSLRPSTCPAPRPSTPITATLTFAFDDFSWP